MLTLKTAAINARDFMRELLRTNSSSVLPGRNDRLRVQDRLADRLPGEKRAFIEPAPRGRHPPEGLPLGITQIPPGGLMVGIDRQIVAGEELDAVTIRIAQVRAKRVGPDVRARPGGPAG